MPLELLVQYLKLPVFALVAARLGGLLMFQPVLGALSIPMNIRVLLVLGLAVLVTPVVGLPAEAPDTPLGVLLAMALEVLLGGVIGLVGFTCFMGLQWGAQLIGQECGLAFGQIVDPTSEEEETVVGVFYIQVAVVLYLVVGGHRALVSACLDTFASIPLLSSGPGVGPGLDLLLKALALGGQVALRIAAPTMLALFLANAAMGFVSRTMPQLNVLAVGFSIKSLLAFLLMAVSLPAAGDAFLDSVEQAYAWVHELIGS